MSNRAWIATVVVGVAILAVLTAYGWKQIRVYQVEHAQQRQEASAYETETAEQYLNMCFEDATSVLAVLACIPESVEANREAQRSKYDLQAQQDMAEWAYALLLLTIGGLVVSVLGLSGLFWSLSQTRTAIRDNRELGEAQVRAYLSVAEIKVNLSSVMQNMMFVFCIRNSGQSPAREVVGQFWAWFDILPKQGQGVRVIQYEFEMPMSGVEAGDCHETPQTCKSSTADMWRPVMRRIEDGEEGVLTVAGAINYKDAFGRDWNEPFHMAGRIRHIGYEVTLGLDLEVAERVGAPKGRSGEAT